MRTNWCGLFWQLFFALFLSAFITFSSQIHDTWYMVQYNSLFQYHFPIRQSYSSFFLAEMTRALCTCIQYTTTCALVCSHFASSGHSGTIEEVCNCAILQLWNCAIVQGPFLAGAKIGACLTARPSFAYNPYKSRNLQAGTALLTHFWWNPKIPGDFLTLPILGMVGYGVLQSRKNLFRPSKRKTWSWWTWKCGV